MSEECGPNDSWPSLDRATLQELSDLFVSSANQLSTLEALSAELKRRKSDDETRILHMKVAFALARARCSGKSSAPTPAATQKANLVQQTTILDQILRRCGQTAPDGRMLFRYEVTNDEFNCLERFLVELHSRRALDHPGGRAAAAFVLYASEWYRRHYAGDGLKWIAIAPHILSKLPYESKTEIARTGLAWWQRPIRRINGAEERLLSIALEGGFPTRVLEERERGWLSTHLRALIGRLTMSEEPDEDRAFALAQAESEVIPPSFRTDEMLQLCADLALSIDRLKRASHAGRPNGISISSWLDAVRPTWRDELPIRIEGEGARHLVDDLINARADRLTGDVDARCHRVLARNGATWSPALRLATDGWVSGLGKIADELDGRIRVRPAGALADRLVGDIAILEPPGHEGPWRARPRQRLESITGFAFTEPVQVELIGSRDARSVIWPHGETCRGEVLVFADLRPEEAWNSEPDVLELIASGSTRSRRGVLYVLTPKNFTAKAEVGEIAPYWRDDKNSLFRVTSPTRIGSEGNWWRVAPGESGEVADTLDIHGGAPQGMEPLDAGVWFVTQPVEVRTRRGVRFMSPPVGEVFWRRPGERDEHDITRAPLPFGRVDVVWRDPSAHVIRDRVRLAVFPQDARTSSRPQAGGAAIFALKNLDGWKVRLGTDTPAEATVSVAGLIVKFPGRPQRVVNLTLAPPQGGESLDISAQFPSADGGFARADGTLFRQSQRIVLGDLHGARAFTDGRRSLTMELRSEGGSASRQIKFDEELPLWNLSDDIARLASASDHVDDHIRLTIDPGGRRIEIGSYSVEISTSRRRIEVKTAADVGRKGPFRLEWKSVWDASERGCRQLLEAQNFRDITSIVFEPPADLIGPGVILLWDGDLVIGRPSILFCAGPLDVEELSPLQNASIVADVDDRQAAIDDAFKCLAIGTSAADADLAFLHTFIAGLQGIPLIAFNVLGRLPRHLGAAAMILVSAPTAEIRERVWRLERDLNFLWVLVPVDAWRRAFANQALRLRQALKVSGLEDDVSERLVQIQLQDIAERLIEFDDMLARPLSLAGVRAFDLTPARSQRDIAMDRIRRSAESGNVGSDGCVFHDDPRIAPSLPLVDTYFDPSFRQALVAPYAAAMSAAGLVALSVPQIIVVRSELAEDPLHFAEAYTLGLTEAAKASRSA